MRIILFLMIQMGLLSNAFPQVTYVNKSISFLQGFYDAGDCIYFKLDGVTQADPVKPGDPHFAISGTQPGAKNAYAMLLAAKIAGQTIRVTTRPNLVCGYAGVNEIIIQ